MNLLELPHELLLLITELIDYSWDVNSLGLVNRRLHAASNPYLYQHRNQYTRISTLTWGVETGNTSIVSRLPDQGILDECLREEDNEDTFAAERWVVYLSIAARWGQVEIVQLFLDFRERLGPEIASSLTQDNSLGYPLWRAAQRDQAVVTQLLLQHGASPTSVPRNQHESPLSYAARIERLNAVKVMIEWLLISGRTDELGLSELLNKAIRQNRTGVVQYLLEKGADANTRNVNVYGLLCAATAESQTEIVRHLLEHGTDPRSIGPGGYSALSNTMGDHTTTKLVLDKILQTTVLSQCGEKGELLCAAAVCGYADQVRELLESGCDPNSSSVNRTALCWAADARQEDMVRLLLDHGAELDHNALLSALYNQDLSITQLLLDRGLDPNTCHKKGDYPAASIAAQDEALLKLVLDNGADPTRGGIPQVQMLLDRGLRIEIHPDAHLHGGVATNATRHGYLMLKFLVDSGLLTLPTGNTQEDVSAVLAAINGLDLASLEFLLEKGVQIPPNEQASMLDYLFEKDATLDTIREMLDTLLGHGVDINAPELDGHTCVHNVLRPRKAKYLGLLFDRGADPLRYDNEGQIPLYVAAIKGYVEWIRVILESIDLCHVSTDRLRIELWEAIQQASRRESWKVVRLLERYRHDHGLYTLPRKSTKEQKRGVLKSLSLGIPE